PTSPPRSPTTPPTTPPGSPARPTPWTAAAPSAPAWSSPAHGTPAGKGSATGPGSLPGPVAIGTAETDDGSDRDTTGGAGHRPPGRRGRDTAPHPVGRANANGSGTRTGRRGRTASRSDGGEPDAHRDAFPRPCADPGTPAAGPPRRAPCIVTRRNLPQERAPRPVPH